MTKTEILDRACEIRDTWAALFTKTLKDQGKVAAFQLLENLAAERAALHQDAPDKLGIRTANPVKSMDVIGTAGDQLRQESPKDWTIQVFSHYPERETLIAETGWLDEPTARATFEQLSLTASGHEAHLLCKGRVEIRKFYNLRDAARF